MPSIVIPASKKEFIFIYVGNQFNPPSGDDFAFVRQWIADNKNWRANLDQLEKEVGLPIRMEIISDCNTNQELCWVIESEYQNDLEHIDKYKRVLSDSQTKPIMIRGDSAASIRRVKKNLVPFL